MVTLTDTNLAEMIGEDIPGDRRVYWQREDLPAVTIALRTLRLSISDDSFLIDAVMPYWLYICILAALAPKSVLLNSPNFGPIAVPQNKPEGSGRGVSFKTFEDEHFTLVQFLSPRTLPAEQLATIVPPAVNPNKGVVIASTAPYWVIGTVALAYAKSAAWVACTQKYGDAIVAVSNDKATALGTEIDRLAVSNVVQKASRAAIPKRGEIWLFDEGYGQHPCLILSPTSRNEQSNDVLMVPFTSSPTHAHRHLAVAPRQTGLSNDSYAQFSNISRLGKEQLIQGPVSEVTADLLADIVRHVRLAIGDAA
ncbi:MAG: type II toxin-antitoxin system PemK/MazF family toxin [Cyanobacteria bacterium SZAS LIN-3]|nr:type II toxin-antitoxin system PemK/MazF family toxin [Cyanobacteria bacterium SZAS LIN-3]